MTKETGERVRALRIARGIAQADLAASVGVSKSYLSHIEAGRRPIGGALLQRVADALEVEVSQLESGMPTGLHEDLELKLAFAELSARNGEWAAAAEEFAAIAERARSLPLGRYLDEATFGLARAEEGLGHLESAIVHYEELLSRPLLGAAVSRVAVSTRLLMAYSECGDYGRAVDIGEHALEQVAEQEPPDDVTAVVELISSVAGCYLERGDLTRAQILIDRALALSSEDGTPRARAAASWNAALIAEKRHDAIGARRHADRALALYSEMDSARAVAMIRVASASLRLEETPPDAETALADIERAIGELEEVGSRLDFGYAYSLKALALLRLGEATMAGEVGRQALQYLSTGDRQLTGHTMIVLGHVAVLQGETDERWRTSPRPRPRSSRPTARARPAPPGGSWARPTSSSAVTTRASPPCAAPATSPARRTTRCVVQQQRGVMSPVEGA
jgi:transcriptional regulator with XRE-family HTH domain